MSIGFANCLKVLLFFLLFKFLINLGENDEPVGTNLRPKSIGTSKNFPGQNMLTSVSAVRKWIQALSNELSKRLMDDYEKVGHIFLK